MRAERRADDGRIAVVGSKFGCPEVPARAIVRPRLAQALAGGEWRVGLVTGGAATGKTVLTSQWFGALTGVAREWVTLDAHDDRPERFWLAVAVALDRALPGAFADTLAAAVDVHRVQPDFVDRLLIEWSGVSQPLVLVLDDAHHLRNASIIADLSTVIEQLPQGSKLLLTSRVDPALPVARWRARSWLAELHQRDLAFTLPETISLFAALDEDRLGATEVEELWRHTEGWVAGLRLAAATLRNRADVPAAVAEFSGRNPLVADLLAEELLYHAPGELTEFLLRTSVVEVLDAPICDGLSGRDDSGELLRGMEAELQFVTATGPDRDHYRYHPLLAEMLRSELQRRHPDEVLALNRKAAAILEARGDVAGAVRCRLAGGDIDRAFSIVFVEAYARHDRADIPGVAAFVNLFPRELVAVSAFRMLTYALMLGLCGRADEGLSWLQRAAMRIAADPASDVRDLATLDAVRLLGFTTTAEVDDALDAGERAVEAVERGIDLGVIGARTRMNLVRGYLLVDAPADAERVFRSGGPGDEIATLLIAPALAARIALRDGRLNEAERQATTALKTARSFGLDGHFGAVDAHLAEVGVLIERNELADAKAASGQLEEILRSYQQALPYHVLFQLEQARIAAALGQLDDVFTILRTLQKLVNNSPQSALRRMVDATAARWHLEVGETDHAEELITLLPADSPTHPLLHARLELSLARPDAAVALLVKASFATMRDELIGDLLLARAAVDLGDDAVPHVTRAVELAAPEHLVRLFLEEGTIVTRLARKAADSLPNRRGVDLALALGLPRQARAATRQATVVLSERELSVLRFLPSRLTNAEIGAECFMSVNTVKTHLKRIYEKLGVSARADAVARARLLGLL